MYISRDYGATFAVTSAGLIVSTAGRVAISSDGRLVIAMDTGGAIYYSTNFGATFSSKLIAYGCAGMSGDGRLVTFGASGTGYLATYLAGSLFTSHLAVTGKLTAESSLTTAETASLVVGSGGVKAWNAALTAAPTITVGDATPEGAVTAPVGSLFLRTNGGAGTSLYVKESGSGNTGWVGK